MLKSKTKTTFIVSVFIIILFCFFSFAFGAGSASINMFRTINKNYLVSLIGHVYRLPEWDVIEFNDNGTFILTSDMWDAPAIGTYEITTSTIKAEGTTGIYYDEV